MTILELLDNEDGIEITEAVHVGGNDYPRYWHHFTDEEKEEYKKEHPNAPKAGRWIYYHREAAGLTYKDRDKLVHHRDHNKHNFDKSNLQIVTRSEHAIIDPNALKHKGEKCKTKGCNGDYFSRGMCYRCYQKWYRETHKKPKKSK